MPSGGKRPGAGRPKGATNKHSREISERLDAMGVDPIEAMAWIASNNKEALGITEDVPIAIRAQMLKELAPYVAYKLKAVEVVIESPTTMSHEDRLAHLR